MSSDFYPSSLSRNLVRTGAFGYRENAALHLLLSAAEDVARNAGHDRGSTVNFVAFPDFDRKAKTGPKVVSFGRTHLRTLALSRGKHPFTGPLPV
ncbi:hypothetical protein NOF55_21105 [Rhizobiaceae bacterium BDR2-2]|uniref:Uncharacterized protein n=1 Tax=Ectorhizobium quercum TaxID=2965071 RepID=A0AAE3SXC0_9HYPH|nr:hypothetical protein [Ectorhizobium quercum]MCX8999608.1 hypothetical protein [Ectorhizobium quercum]